MLRNEEVPGHGASLWFNLNWLQLLEVIFFFTMCSANDLTGAAMTLTSPLGTLQHQLKQAKKELLISSPQSFYGLCHS